MAANDKYQVIITPQAQRDINLSCSYITEELYASDAAIKLVEEIDSHLARLEEYPLSCPLLLHPFVSNRNVHKLLINKNYVALYTVHEEEQRVYIIGVFNTARDYIQYLLNYNLV